MNYRGHMCTTGIDKYVWAFEKIKCAKYFCLLILTLCGECGFTRAWKIPRKGIRKTAKSCCVVKGWDQTGGLEGMKGAEVSFWTVLSREVSRGINSPVEPVSSTTLSPPPLLWSKLRYVLYNTFNYDFLMLFYRLSFKVLISSVYLRVFISCRLNSKLNKCFFPQNDWKNTIFYK